MDRETYPERVDGLTLPAIRVELKKRVDGTWYRYTPFNCDEPTPQEKTLISAMIQEFEETRTKPNTVPTRHVLFDHPDDSNLYRRFEIMGRVTEDPDTLSYKLVAIGWQEKCPESQLSAADSSEQTADSAKAADSTPDTTSETPENSPAKSKSLKKESVATPVS